jgi:hypothetical protein
MFLWSKLNKCNARPISVVIMENLCCCKLQKLGPRLGGPELERANGSTACSLCPKAHLRKYGRTLECLCNAAATDSTGKGDMGEGRGVFEFWIR